MAIPNEDRINSIAAMIQMGVDDDVGFIVIFHSNNDMINSGQTNMVNPIPILEEYIESSEATYLQRESEVNHKTQ